MIGRSPAFSSYGQKMKNKRRKKLNLGAPVRFPAWEPGEAIRLSFFVPEEGKLAKLYWRLQASLMVSMMDELYGKLRGSLLNKLDPW
jgi:hypothetical protein